MGLDMYLQKINNQALAYKDEDVWDLHETNPALYEKLKPYMKKTKYGNFDTIHEEVGYWRKANQIHNWFVENVQDGVDDCSSYIVSKEQIEELLDVCVQVKESITLIDGEVRNGQISKNGVMVDNIEPGKQIVNTAVAEELLPTCAGFFFGSTDYDQWYAEDIYNTIEILEQILDDFDFENYTLLYSASW